MTATLPILTCVLAEDRPDWCCFDISHGLAVSTVTVQYDHCAVAHVVCADCSDAADSGRLPEQHVDGTVTAIRELVR